MNEFWEDLVGITAKNQEIWCGRCDEPIGSFLVHTFVYCTDNGNLIVGDGERALHRCATLTKEDELDGLRAAGKAFEEERRKAHPHAYGEREEGGPAGLC